MNDEFKEYIKYLDFMNKDAYLAVGLKRNAKRYDDAIAFNDEVHQDNFILPLEFKTADEFITRMLNEELQVKLTLELLCGMYNLNVKSVNQGLISSGILKQNQLGNDEIYFDVKYDSSKSPRENLIRARGEICSLKGDLRRYIRKQKELEHLAKF